MSVFLPGSPYSLLLEQARMWSDSLPLDARLLQQKESLHGRGSGGGVGDRRDYYSLSEWDWLIERSGWREGKTQKRVHTRTCALTNTRPQIERERRSSFGSNQWGREVTGEQASSPPGVSTAVGLFSAFPGSGCAAAGVFPPRRGWTDRVTMALVEPEGNNRLLQDVLARPGNDTCADCGNPGKKVPVRGSFTAGGQEGAPNQATGLVSATANVEEG